MTASLAPEPGERNAVGVDLTAFVHNDVMSNVDDRRLAEFTEAEIVELLRQEGFGSVARASKSVDDEESGRASASSA